MKHVILGLQDKPNNASVNRKLAGYGLFFLMGPGCGSLTKNVETLKI